MIRRSQQDSLGSPIARFTSQKAPVWMLEDDDVAARCSDTRTVNSGL